MSMEMEDLTMLAAASLLAGKARRVATIAPGGKQKYSGTEPPQSVGEVGVLPNDAEIREAVKTAKRIWTEVLRQKRERE